MVTLTAESSVSSATPGTGLTISGVITDGANTFGISKVGNGTVTLTAENTYKGTTNVDTGTLVVRGLNATADLETITIDACAIFNINKDATVANAVTNAGGPLRHTACSCTLDGVITLLHALPTRRSSDLTGLTISGVITDGANTFGISKVGNGTVTLTAENTYKGTTNVDTGTLVV